MDTALTPDAALMPTRAGAGRASRDRNRKCRSACCACRGYQWRMGLAAAAMVAIVIGIGNLIPRQPVAPDQPSDHVQPDYAGGS